MKSKGLAITMIALLVIGGMSSWLVPISSAASEQMDTTSAATSKVPQVGTPPTGTPPTGTPPTGTPPTGTPPTGTPPTGTPPSGGIIQTKIVNGTALTSIVGKNITKKSITLNSTKGDQSLIKASSNANVTLTSVTLNKKSGKTSSEDSSNFNGLNAALLAESGSQVRIKKSSITTNADGSNALFSTGTGTKVIAENVTIDTKDNSSRGIDATYNGTIIAKNLKITTAGVHSAAIATDRGEGTIQVTGGTMKTTGVDSPGIYSTGNITVTDAQITATGSEAAVIEGKNSIVLNNTQISGSKKSGIMIYQSFSGDASVGTGNLTINGGKLTVGAVPIFYITNTQAKIQLNHATISGKSGILIKAAADRWGLSEKNGGNLDLTADKQVLTGDVVLDKVSTIVMTLKNNSTLIGAIDHAKSGGKTTLHLDAESKWNVTADSYLEVIDSTDPTFSNIIDNGHTIYYNADNEGNQALQGKTIPLIGGGSLKPIQP